MRHLTQPQHHRRRILRRPVHVPQRVAIGAPRHILRRLVRRQHDRHPIGAQTAQRPIRQTTHVGVAGVTDVLLDPPKQLLPGQRARPLEHPQRRIAEHRPVDLGTPLEHQLRHQQRTRRHRARNDPVAAMKPRHRTLEVAGRRLLPGPTHRLLGLRPEATEQIRLALMGEHVPRATSVGSPVSAEATQNACH